MMKFIKQLWPWTRETYYHIAFMVGGGELEGNKSVVGHNTIRVVGKVDFLEFRQKVEQDVISHVARSLNVSTEGMHVTLWISRV